MISRRMTAMAAVIATALPLQAQTLLFRVTGSNQDDYLAESVAMVGDFNHDGYDDFIVGAKFDDSNGANAGVARVYSGKDSSVLLSVAGGDGDWLGIAVAGAGDVNKDGYADVIIGASGDDPNGTNSGSAYLYSGQTGLLLRTFHGFAAFDHFGRAVAGVGDVDGDGADDVAIGAPQEGNGTVRVYSGDSGNLIWTFTGIDAGDAFGDAVNGAGDVTGDGFADVIVGAPLGDLTAVDGGYAQVYSGRTGNLIWTLAAAPAITWEHPSTARATSTATASTTSSSARRSTSRTVPSREARSSARASTPRCCSPTRERPRAIISAQRWPARGTRAATAWRP
jgi:hypothetical protein